MSKGEDLFFFQCKVYGIVPHREYRFHSSRMWRFDAAFPEIKLAIEIEGGSWVNGRHNRGKGMEEDARKYNSAVVRGWRVLRFTTSMVKSGEAIDLVRSFVETK